MLLNCQADKSAVSDGGEDQGAEEALWGHRESPGLTLTLALTLALTLTLTQMKRLRMPWAHRLRECALSPRMCLPSSGLPMGQFEIWTSRVW